MVKEVQDGWSEEEVKQDQANEDRQDAEDSEAAENLRDMLDAQDKEDLIKAIMDGNWGKEVLEYLGYYI